MKIDNHYDVSFFKRDDSVLYKEDKIKYIESLYTLEDKRDFRLCWKTFQNVSEYEDTIGKNVLSWNENEFNEFLIRSNDLREAIVQHSVLKKYISFVYEKCKDANCESTLKSINIVNIDKLYNNEIKTLITYKELHYVINDIINGNRTNENKFYEASLIILLYYGIPLGELHNISINDITNMNLLYAKIDDEFKSILQESCKLYKLNYKVNKCLSGKPDIIVKITQFKNKTQSSTFYTRILNRALIPYIYLFNLSAKKLNMSGAIHYFVRDCINESLPLDKDLSYIRSPEERVEKYNKIANKYGITYSSLKQRRASFILKEYNEQKKVAN